MYKKTVIKAALVLGVAGSSIGVTLPSFAAAFQIWEQGASIGLYHAGGAAIADDATTDYYNSAGLVRLTKPQLSVGGANITTHVRFKGNVLTPYAKPAEAEGGDSNIVPNLHYAQPITDKVVFGFSITMPLGLDTNYGDDNPVSVSGTKSKLEAFNFSPSIGFKVNDKLSFGLGVDAQKLKAEFDQHIYLPTMQFNSVNKLDDWGYGYHLGAFYQFSPATRLGLSFRSQIIHHAKGTSTLTSIGGGNPSSNSDAKVGLVMPSIAMLSLYHDFGSKFSAMGTISYIKWGIFNVLALENVQTPIGEKTISVPQYFRNTWNLSVGGIYHVSQRFDLRASVGYDETPVRNEYRTLQVPDGNRYVVGLGAKYNVTDAFSVEGGWNHFFIHKSGVDSIISTVHVKGNVDSSADVLGLQFNYTFG